MEKIKKKTTDLIYANQPPQNRISFIRSSEYRKTWNFRVSQRNQTKKPNSKYPIAFRYMRVFDAKEAVKRHHVYITHFDSYNIYWCKLKFSVDKMSWAKSVQAKLNSIMSKYT